MSVDSFWSQVFSLSENDVVKVGVVGADSHRPMMSYEGWRVFVPEDALCFSAIVLNILYIHCPWREGQSWWSSLQSWRPPAAISMHPGWYCCTTLCLRCRWCFRFSLLEQPHIVWLFSGVFSLVTVFFLVQLEVLKAKQTKKNCGFCYARVHLLLRRMHMSTHLLLKSCSGPVGLSCKSHLPPLRTLVLPKSISV